jgi:ABC-2 type transport system permease protein
MMTALLGRSFRRARALLISLAAVLVLFQALVVTAAEYLEKQQGFAQIVALLPVLAQQLMGAIFSSFAAMVAFGYFHPVVVIVFVGLAIVMASEPAADVESGVVDLVLGRPVARAHLVSRSVLVLILATGGIAALMVTASRLSTATIAPAHAATIPLPTLLRLAANLVAVSWVAGAFALAAAAVVGRRGTAVGSAGIVALVAYLLNVLAELWPRVRPYGKLSPFHYYQPMTIINGSGVAAWATDVAILLVASACLIAFAYAAFARRDL